MRDTIYNILGGILAGIIIATFLALALLAFKTIIGALLG